MLKTLGFAKRELNHISAYCEKNNLTVAEYIARRQEIKDEEIERKVNEELLKKSKQ